MTQYISSHINKLHPCPKLNPLQTSDQPHHLTAMGTTTTANLTVTIALLIIAVVSNAAAIAAYTNHTVGGAAGWFFNVTTNTSSANFSSWAATQTFSLGDFLIFKTTTNQTVVQTYNKTTYTSCTTDDASDNDTLIYDGGSDAFNQALTVEIPLTIEGLNYYFSDADDGVQCQGGMAFQIVVSHGQGLPPSLNQPPPPPYAEPPAADTAQSPPATTPVVQQKSNGAGARSAANMRVMVCILFLMMASGMEL